MSLVRGFVIRSLRGRDKGKPLVMLEASGRGVVVCGGKHRPLERSKRKNPVRLTAANTLLSSMNINRETHCALQCFSQDS